MTDAIAALWTADAAAAATGGRLAGGSDWAASGVSIDTRSLQPGDLFVALTDQRDGHDFAPAAFKAGASAALVSREDAAQGPRLVVDDVQSALEALGAAARDRSSAIRIAVTGSVGKTSVKDALGAVCAAAGGAHWSVKSFNNHWGVPLTLARMPQASTRGVFELGMNHAGEIRALTAQVRPHIAVITRIAPAHLENLGSMEAIADAKAEIFESLSDDGVAVLPADDEFSARLADAVRASRAGFLLDFGFSERAAVRVVSHTPDGEGAAVRFDVMGRPLSVKLAAAAPHHAVNAAAVLAAACAAGVDTATAGDAISRQASSAGRGASFEIPVQGGGRAVIMDDSYNANPVSMNAAIDALAARAPQRGGRRLAVIGEMLELGPQAAAYHAALASPLSEAGAHRVIGVGGLTEALISALPQTAGARYANTPGEAFAMLISELRDGDVVLIKGSNASGVHKVVAMLHEHAAQARTEA
ncbi:MAG: UDP-N-acetylmuramoyl-tripeptide--D-alanyl-D-alanine ligase [Pseudomonadota bacterium]